MELVEAELTKAFKLKIKWSPTRSQQQLKNSTTITAATATTVMLGHSWPLI